MSCSWQNQTNYLQGLGKANLLTNHHQIECLYLCLCALLPSQLENECNTSIKLVNRGKSFEKSPQIVPDCGNLILEIKKLPCGSPLFHQTLGP